MVCHSGLDPESSVFSGFLLEFIPLKNGAGMTAFALFNVALYKYSELRTDNSKLMRLHWRLNHRRESSSVCWYLPV